jgi:serine/threonine protein kinase
MPVEWPLQGITDSTWAQPDAAKDRRLDSIDDALSHHREDWAKGIRTPIATRLLECGSICADPIAAAELIYQEFTLRRGSTETMDWDGLLREFPQYAEHLKRIRDADEIVEAAFDSADRTIAQPVGYELFEEVGRGGMGVVYRAREHSLDRTVAIKRIRGGALAEDGTIGRFLKEAKSVSRLNHPNIVHIYRVGDCDGEPFIALEFVDGPTLGQRVSGTPLTPELAATISAAIARAIQYAHEHGIIHRDLKPANILLAGTADEPIPKVSDFGAAKELDHASDRSCTQFLGTPSYMAPEQVETKWGMSSALTDIYGIGALLYEALTGRPPFRADSVGETLRQVVEKESVSPRLLNPAVPCDLETICLKCLRKEPSRRYHSAAALADDLERFLGGQPIHARRSSSGVRAWMWCRRKPGTAGLVAALLLALLGGIAGITVQWGRAEAARKSAVASDVEAQGLLGEWLDSNPTVLPGGGDRRSSGTVESLLNAEAHCTSLLQKNPDEIKLRIALTRIYGGLGAEYVQLGQAVKADAKYREAQRLWESLPPEAAKTREAKEWLATTYSWHGGDDLVTRFQLLQRAAGIWRQLAEQQPDNLNLIAKIWACHDEVMFYTTSGLLRHDCLPLCEQDWNELTQLITHDPGDRAARGKLALTCFLLGEIHNGNGSPAKASPYWGESCRHYEILAKDGREDLITDVSLAIVCSRLMRSQSTDPYYVRAVQLLERDGRRLKALSEREPQAQWLRALLLKDYCYLALCHAKARETAKAQQVANDQVSALTSPVDLVRVEAGTALEHALMLLAASQLLREAKLSAAALRLANQAGTVGSQLAGCPSHNLGFLDRLGFILTNCSALANQLGEPRLSLQQAELGRRVLEELVHSAPDRRRDGESLSSTWMRIAKAHWSLGERDQALAAFRQSAALNRRNFDREPSNRFYRAWLSRSYDRLILYGAKAGDLQGAAEAIRERTKLWPGDVVQLSKAAEDFESLAQQVTTRSHGKPSSQDQAEHDRYLAESRRAREAAANAATKRELSNLRVER